MDLELATSQGAGSAAAARRPFSGDAGQRTGTPRLAAEWKRSGLWAAGAAAALALGGGVLHVQGSAAEPPAATPPAAVAVGVQTAREQSVRTWSQFSGRMHAVDSAEIRPEVSGRITEVRFQDGQLARAGDVLFVIDPRPYAAAAAKTSANLAAARTNAGFARTELDRATELVKTQAIAQRLHDQLANADRVAQAAIRAAEAELVQARLDLDHAYVKAPISGRLGRAEITLGNLVQSGPNAPVLTSIVSTDGIYADFEVDEQTYLNAIRTDARERAQERSVPVELALKGDATRLYSGTIHAFDNRIDTASGTIRARARFANEDGSLMPGMFVSVQLGSPRERPAVLVPDRAIGTDQSKKFVYVVGDADRVEYREVELGASVRGQRIVLAGVQPGDRVVVDGIQHVRPDVVVDAREIASGPAADGK